MRFAKWTIAIVLVTGLAFVIQAQEKGGEEETGPYEVVENWPQQLPGHAGWTWGSTGGVFAESDNKVFVIQRGELPIPQPRSLMSWSVTRAKPIAVEANGAIPLDPTG